MQGPGPGGKLRDLARRIGQRLKGPPPTPREPVRVVFEGRGEGTVPYDTTILQAARLLDVPLTHYCGGNCTCGTCRVGIQQGADRLSEKRGNEQMVLGEQRARQGDRLACQARLQGPVVVKIPDWF